MGMKAVAGTLLGMTCLFVAWVPMQAQGPESAEPPKKAASEPKQGEGLAGNQEQKTLNELWSRREKAFRELRLVEAQLAVKKAEAQRANAEVRDYHLQHPDVVPDAAFLDKAAIEKSLASDPVVAQLKFEIEHAKARVQKVARAVRTPTDPAIVQSARWLREREAKLRERIHLHNFETLLPTSSRLSAGDPRSADDRGEKEQKLDQIIEELQDLRRDLRSETRNP